MWSLSSVVGALPSQSICARQRRSVRRPEGREEGNRAFVKRGGGGARNMVRGILPRSRLVQHLPTHRQTMTIPSPSEPSPSEIR